MKGKSEDEIIIDGPVRQSHTVAIVLMVMVILAIISGAVWFFGFSQWGIAWEGNNARRLVDAPDDVVTWYPSVTLSLSDVSLMLEPDQKSRLHVSVKRDKNAADINLSDVRLRWVSQNPNVAEVSVSGVVTAVGIGSAYITVSVANEDINANPINCLVTVRQWADRVNPADSIDAEEERVDDDHLDFDDEYDRSRHSTATATDKPTQDVNVASLSGRTEVFSGLGVLDKSKMRIEMTASKSFILKVDGNLRVVTLRKGDYITDVVLNKDGYLTDGVFHVGSSTIKASGLRIRI